MSQELPRISSLQRVHSLKADVSKEESKRSAEAESSDLDPELQAIYERLSDAEKNHGDMEVKSVLLEKAQYFIRKNNKERALDSLQQVYDKSVGNEARLDLVFIALRAMLSWGDLPWTTKYVSQAKELLEGGGDWERKNKLLVYEALLLLMTRQFEKAADNLLTVTQTFNATEVLSYEKYSEYVIVVTLLTQQRPVIKQLLETPDIMAVMRQAPHLETLLGSFYRCQYAQFFNALVSELQALKSDFYLQRHVRFISRQLRLVAYRQFLRPYCSVGLEAMALSFGVGVRFIEEELFEFISQGKLPCKMDKERSLVVLDQRDQRDVLYENILKQGDQFINRMQKLTRLIS